MARLATKRPAPDDDGAIPVRRNTARRVTPNHPAEIPAESPSPAMSFSSDKENRALTAAGEARGKSRGSNTATLITVGTSRRGLEDRSVSAQAQRRDGEAPTGEQPSEESGGSVRETSGRKEDTHSILDTRFYDPEQTLVERRPVRKAIRDLTRELQESRNDYMAAHSNGIYETLLAANAQFGQIKQTSDATLDANLLVKAADLAARRAVQNRAGGAVRGLDAAEFAAKCASFMRRGPAPNQLASLASDIQSAVNRNTGRQRIGAGSDGEDETQAGATQGTEDGDELNWAWLGLRAAAPASARPRVPGFLLGPLSVQKKVRAISQRTARQAPADPSTAVRPAELDAGAIERVENANLTALCRKIFKTLRRYKHETSAQVEAQVRSCDSEVEPEELDQILDAHHLRDDGGVCLFNFAFDPLSFGQTVENLFYISFLVRDGKAGLAQDTKGRLSLHATDPTGGAGGANSNSHGAAGGKSQAVFHLDFDTWRDVCEEFKLQKCIIGHRADDAAAEIAAGGWYG